jgi:hypothetical protein
MRFYARHPRPQFKTDVDKQNWFACESAINTFDELDREILMAVYRDNGTIPEAVYYASLYYETEPDNIWKLVKELERKVARRRGLI